MRPFATSRRFPSLHSAVAAAALAAAGCGDLLTDPLPNGPRPAPVEPSLSAAASTTCKLTPSPARVDLDAAPHSFQVTFRSSCSSAQWQVLGPQNTQWATITSGTSGTGASFTVRGQLLANTGSQPRGFTLQVRRSGSRTAAASVDVVQAGFSQPPVVTPPAIVVSPNPVTLTRGTQTASFTVTAAPNVCYTITKDRAATWLSFIGSTHLCGTQTVKFSVTFNSGKPRSAVVAVGAATVSVQQAGST